MRIVKEYEERRKEILERAERLFVTKGYTKTTVNDILKEIGIAKGTFYHYFKSKEEVMDEIIMRIIKEDVAKAKVIVSNPNIPVLEKLFRVLMEQPPRGASKNGILVTAYNPANISARPVISSTYNDRAKRKSVEPKIVIICPLTIK